MVRRSLFLSALALLPLGSSGFVLPSRKTPGAAAAVGAPPITRTVPSRGPSWEGDDVGPLHLFGKGDAKEADGDVECVPEEDANPMTKIKELGVAGTVSFVLWEWAFWIIGGGGAVAAYYFANGHWPDLNNKEDLAVAGGEAFAFINVARLAVPVRIGLAISTAPWCDENIVQRFFPKEEVCVVPEEAE